MQQQAKDFEMWADKQASKLQAEQQNMRERANKQWAEIDSMHEKRIRARRNGPPHGPRGAQPPSYSFCLFKGASFRNCDTYRNLSIAQ